MRYMLDTNICIYVIKHKPEKVFRKIQTIYPEDVCVSSVTYAELVHGVEKSAAVEKNRLARGCRNRCCGNLRLLMKIRPFEPDFSCFSNDFRKITELSARYLKTLTE